MGSSVISNLDLENGENETQGAAGRNAAARSVAVPLPVSGSADTRASSQRQGIVSSDSGLESGSGSGRSGFSTPLAPRDVLAAAPMSAAHESALDEVMLAAERREPSSSSYSQGIDRTPSSGSAAGATTKFPNPGEDSALDALLEAHGRQSSGSLASPLSISRGQQRQASEHSHASPSSHIAPGSESSSQPDTGDASFGLDPDADTNHSVRGAPFRPLFSSPLRSSHHGGHHHDSHDHHSTNNHHDTDNAYEAPETHSASHSTAAAGAPHTTHSHVPHTETVPTVSATGAPRFLPRRTSRSPSPAASDEKRSGRHRKGATDEDDDDGAPSSTSDAPPPREAQPSYAPSGSLTVALFTPGISWRRRSFLLLASVAINVGLPFINGVMLGFGEIFARSIVAPWIGLAPAAININAPARPTHQQAAGGSGGGGGAGSTTGSVGLRAAGARASA